MNIKVLQWLLKNQATLLKIVEVSKGWAKAASEEEKWAVIDAIARLVIPLIKAQNESPKALAVETDSLFAEPDEYFALGADYAALGVDWKMITEVILPIVIAILQALAAKEP